MIAPDIVEVGREYPVTCILDHGNWLPVFPTPHHDQDPEFFVNVPEHFHYDRRFINTTFDAVKSLGQPMEVRPVTCLRETHIPPQHIIWMHLALLKHFEGHRLKNPLVCPHKGMPIINGVCAGHGLKWNAQGYLKHRGPFKLRWGENVGEVKSLERSRAWRGSRFQSPSNTTPFSSSTSWTPRVRSSSHTVSRAATRSTHTSATW